MTSIEPTDDNLLLRLFTYSPREGRSALEDFCTEALAWCLRTSPLVSQENAQSYKTPGFARSGLSPSDQNRDAVQICNGQRRAKCGARRTVRHAYQFGQV